MTKIDDNFTAYASTWDDRFGILKSTSPPPDRAYARYGKRVLDIFFTLVSVIVLLPVMCLIALSVMLSHSGTPFFKHRRIGKNGAPFMCWKFRTMVPNAETRLKDYLADNPKAQKEWKENFKLTHDPRITRLGRLLRCSSMDELPQMWNIIKGDMSIVGPRPVTEEELSMYGPSLHYYHSVRPGLTGSWQVSGRNDTSYSDRVDLDVNYAKTFTFRMDLCIIKSTVKAVIYRTGR